MRLKVQFPGRRTVLVMYGEMVARLAGPTGGYAVLRPGLAAIAGLGAGHSGPFSA